MSRNDQPTNRRMVFGYTGAREAGVERVRPDRSPRQVNKIVKENQEARDAVRELQEAKDDPEWIPFITHRVSQGHTAQQIATELHWIKRYAWAMKSHLSLRSLLKHHWPYCDEFRRK